MNWQFIKSLTFSIHNCYRYQTSYLLLYKITISLCILSIISNLFDYALSIKLYNVSIFFHFNIEHIISSYRYKMWDCNIFFEKLYTLCF